MLGVLSIAMLNVCARGGLLAQTLTCIGLCMHSDCNLGHDDAMQIAVGPVNDITGQ